MSIPYKTAFTLFTAAYGLFCFVRAVIGIKKEAAWVSPDTRELAALKESLAGDPDLNRDGIISPAERYVYEQKLEKVASPINEATGWQVISVPMTRGDRVWCMVQCAGTIAGAHIFRAWFVSLYNSIGVDL